MQWLSRRRWEPPKVAPSPVASLRPDDEGGEAEDRGTPAKHDTGIGSVGADSAVMRVTPSSRHIVQTETVPSPSRPRTDAGTPSMKANGHDSQVSTSTVGKSHDEFDIGASLPSSDGCSGAIDGGSGAPSPSRAGGGGALPSP